MKEITFYKMVATGNDFVVVDNRKKIISNAATFAREVCARHTGIGGDGVLLLENVGAGSPRPEGRGNLAPTTRVDYGVRIFNSDGSEAEACGNGFRCIALAAREKFGFPKKQRFESLAGIVEADVKDGRVSVGLMEPRDSSGREKIQINGRTLHYYFVRVGVPHAVIFVEGLAKIPVLELGRQIRSHPKFKPAGTNVNFVEVNGSNSIKVETYERGVEANTLACGTGSTASALVSARVGYVKPPVRVKTRSGEILTIDFEMKGEKIQNVSLEGEARLVFEGKWKS